MQEIEEERTRRQAARRETQGAPGEENPDGTGEVEIPDYVMMDFDSPKEPRENPGVRGRE